MERARESIRGARVVGPEALVLLALAACQGSQVAAPHSRGEPPAPAATTGASIEERVPEPSELAGGALRARLPPGAAVIGEGAAQPGWLVSTMHEARDASGRLLVVATDTGWRAGERFAASVSDEERSFACAGADAAIVAEPPLTGPSGFEIVAFRPAGACGYDEPPRIRLWVRSPSGDVATLELSCGDEGACPADDRAWLEAFVRTLEPGTPTPAPAGERRLGLVATLTVPEGMLVQESEGEDYEVYELFRRGELGEPYEGLVVSYHFSASPNSLRQDYAGPRDRARLVPGTIAGRRTRLLELVRDGRTRLVGRLELAAVQIDVELVAHDAEALAALRGIVATMEVEDEDEDDE